MSADTELLREAAKTPVEELRTAAQAIRDDAEDNPSPYPWHPAVAQAVADWLDEDAADLEHHIPAWTAPSRGVDEPPAVCWNNPERLAELVEHHFGAALAVARAYLGRAGQ